MDFFLMTVGLLIYAVAWIFFWRFAYREGMKSGWGRGYLSCREDSRKPELNEIWDRLDAEEALREAWRRYKGEQQQ